MTTDEFCEIVQRDGFYGYSPSPNDVLGDRWSAKIGEEFERVAGALPRDEFRHRVWLVFHWLYCQLAGMQGRTIVSPTAMHMCGLDTGHDVIDFACRLLLASVE